MGRGGGEGEELWDDFALLNAFDDAVSKYKKMHGLNKESERVIDTSVAEEEKGRGEESGGDLIRGNAGLEAVNELGRDTTSGAYDSDPQVMEDYNKLLNEYYEIEEKRLAFWQQLQQFGGAYDYQYPAPAPQDSGYDATTLGACSTSYDHSVPVEQASRACDPPVSMCPYPGCCEDNSLATGPGNHALGVDFFKSAVEAAEAAISSLKMKSSWDSGTKEKECETANGGDTRCSKTCETDLDKVLKAWFCAGLYTGKYLAEHSVRKM